MKLPRDLKERFERAKRHKDNWFDLWDDVYEYVLPQRENIYGEHSPGDHKNEDKTYDATARVSLIRLANRIQGAIVPPGSKWFSLEASENVDENAKDEVNERLQENTDTIFKFINRSNFNVEINESLLELGIGTGALAIEDTGDPKTPLRFKAVPITELYLEEGPWNTVETTFREYRTSVANCQRQYVEGMGGKLDDTRMETLRDRPGTKMTVVEMMVYNPEREYWDFYVVDYVKEFIMVHETFSSNPYVVFRWLKSPEEMYGRGPAIQALPDIRTANRIAQLELVNSAFGTYGVHTYDAAEGAISNQIRIEPRALIDIPNGSNLQPLEVGGNYQITQLSLERVQDQIKQTMFADRLPPPTGQVHTATELEIRQRELYQDIGASATRLEHELVIPVVKRVKDILARYNHVDPVEINGDLVDVVIKSPISIDTEEADKTVNYLQTILSIIPPEIAAQEIDLSEAVQYLGERLGVSREIFLSDEDKQALQEQQQQQQQEQGALDQGQQAAEIANKLGVSAGDLEGLVNE